ncbi:ubiquitin domain-containing protein UBFD1 isoform X1 [Monodon monoceros]|uniref:ubiquitin domain-containing protein UBFD1 isoform X1 n=1 Tax=Monodon monoceros TaxID=40151 RepID=UPI0010F61F0A|nr:ubiquitin domain-containing protein UBFD1 isoform X1 [Monodon monoceros]
MRPGAAGGAVWLGSGGPAAPGQNPVPGPARGERPPPNPLAGMEEPSMDTEAETVATEGPARPLSCLEAEAAAGAAAEDSCAARGSLQPAPAQPPGDLAAQASVSNGEDAGGGAGRELVDLKIIWNKTKHDVKFPLDSTGSELKQKIHSITGLPPAMQKVMYKGLVPEDKTLREIKITSGAKIMVVGSTINDVLAVNTPKDAAQQDAKAEENKKEPLCRQKQHRKVLDKGKPEDVMPSVKGAQERLPAVPLSGMYNKSGGKVRLTFKLEQDQLWIGTKERTEKLPMGSIKNVVSEPIEGHEDYHMMVSSRRGLALPRLLLLLLQQGMDVSLRRVLSVEKTRRVKTLMLSSHS